MALSLSDLLIAMSSPFARTPATTKQPATGSRITRLSPFGAFNVARRSTPAIAPKPLITPIDQVLGQEDVQNLVDVLNTPIVATPVAKQPAQRNTLNNLRNRVRGLI